MTQKAPSLFDWTIVGPAIGDSFRKLNPRLMVKNPVMFVTMVGAALTTVTNMTGFLTINRGWSLRKESPMAGPTMFQSKREVAFVVMGCLKRET